MKQCVLISYGTSEYKSALRRIKREADATPWFTSVYTLGPGDLEPKYQHRLKDMLAVKKGGGYWVWKPLIIKTLLDRLEDDDVLIYADAGCFVNRQGDFERYHRLLKNSPSGTFSFEMEHKEEQWTHPSVFDYFQVQEASPVRTSGQLVGGILPFRACTESRRLVERVCEVALNQPHLFSDQIDPEGLPDGFKQHRHDQSIWSVARKLEGTTVVDDDTWARDWSEISHVPIQARRIRRFSLLNQSVRDAFSGLFPR